MRPDLAKLTTEKERGGSKYPSRKWGGRLSLTEDYDNHIGGFYPWGRHRNRDYKNLSDVLNPLEGAIRKNVGRQWDDVYSEFCRLLPRSSMAGYHIWTHLMNFVKVSTWVGDDGYVWYSRNQRYSGAPGRVDRGYYVDPVDGKLCYFDNGNSKRIRQARRYWKNKGNPYIDCVGGGHYTSIDGIWYYFEKRIITQVQNSYKDMIVVDGKVEIVEIPCRRVTTKTEYIKRQIGGNELRKIRDYWADLFTKAKEKYEIEDTNWMGVVRSRIVSQVTTRV